MACTAITTSQLPMLGTLGHCQPLQPAVQGLHLPGLVPVTWPCGFQGPLGPASAPAHTPVRGSQRKRSGESLLSLHLNLPAQASMCSERSSFPSHARPFPSLDWQFSTSPCCHVTLYGTCATVTSGFPFSQGLEGGRRTCPFVHCALTCASLPSATSLPRAGKSVIMCHARLVTGAMGCCRTSLFMRGMQLLLRCLRAAPFCRVTWPYLPVSSSVLRGGLRAEG